MINIELLNIFIHIDQYMHTLIATYHNYIYGIIFMIIFCETGLIITPFLPGDSLLFIIGGFIASGHIDPLIIIIVIFSATFCGDNCNYFVGKLLGAKLINSNLRIINKNSVIKAQQFYNTHSNTAIIIARFIPIIRTFIPFISGCFLLSYKKFIGFSIIGVILWMVLLLGGGYLFGNIPIIRQHLSLLTIIIIIISLLPVMKIAINAYLNK